MATATLPLTQYLPTTNADGLPAVPFTEDQRYLFDTRGWLAVPGVLSEDDIVEMRDFCRRLKDDPKSIPEHERSTVSGPLQKLTDHPKSFMGEKVDVNEFMDTTTKMFYLSESISHLFYKYPNNFKEEMISSKVIGSART